MSSSLTAPRRKNPTKNEDNLPQPLPIFLAGSEDKKYASRLKENYTGQLLQDGSVQVEDPNHCLVHFGSFGSLGCSRADKGSKKSTRQLAKSAENVIHIKKEIPDFSLPMKMHLCSIISPDEKQNMQSYHAISLTNYEAFFLCYAIGCLHVKNYNGDWMNIEDLWMYFKNHSPDFVYKYCVYHHFRAKGWVVKCGYKYGVDFMLYKWGPQFFHASYSVLVVNEDPMSWRELSMLNRVSESVAKELMLAIVSCSDDKPSSKTDDSLAKTFEAIKIDEILVKRWIPSQEREA